MMYFPLQNIALGISIKQSILDFLEISCHLLVACAVFIIIIIIIIIIIMLNFFLSKICVNEIYSCKDTPFWQNIVKCILN